MKLESLKSICNHHLDISIRQFEKSGLVFPVAYFLSNEKKLIWSPLLWLLVEEDVNHFFAEQVQEHKALWGFYIMNPLDFNAEKTDENQSENGGRLLLHCEYPEGKFELLQNYTLDKKGKLILGVRHFVNDDLIGVFSGYFEEQTKQSEISA